MATNASTNEPIVSGTKKDIDGAIDNMVEESPTPDIPDPAPDVDPPTPNDAADENKGLMASVLDRLDKSDDILERLTAMVTRGVDTIAAPIQEVAEPVAETLESVTDLGTDKVTEGLPWTHRFGRKP